MIFFPFLALFVLFTLDTVVTNIMSKNRIQISNICTNIWYVHNTVLDTFNNYSTYFGHYISACIFYFDLYRYIARCLFNII